MALRVPVAVKGGLQIATGYVEALRSQSVADVFGGVIFQLSREMDYESLATREPWRWRCEPGPATLLQDVDLSKGLTFSCDTDSSQCPSSPASAEESQLRIALAAHGIKFPARFSRIEQSQRGDPLLLTLKLIPFEYIDTPVSASASAAPAAAGKSPTSGDKRKADTSEDASVRKRPCAAQPPGDASATAGAPAGKPEQSPRVLKTASLLVGSECPMKLLWHLIGDTFGDDACLGRGIKSGGQVVPLPDIAESKLADFEELTDSKVIEVTPLTCSRSCTLSIKTLSGKTITLCCRSNNTVALVKQEIFRLQCMPQDQQRLVFGGRTLEDGRLISDYNIEDMDTLFLILRLRGGMLQVINGRFNFTIVPSPYDGEPRTANEARAAFKFVRGPPQFW